MKEGFSQFRLAAIGNGREATPKLSNRIAAATVPQSSVTIEKLEELKRR